MNEKYQVKLDAFEGPLDLLLHLINRMEIDIYDIPVADITDQYMHYIHTMQYIELNVASEYLVMAATLLEMKSLMLLPNTENDALTDEYEEDPREQLMIRLIEYRKFKEAAEQLKVKELEENQLYVRPRIILNEEMDRKNPQYDPIPMSELLDALDNILKRNSWNNPLETKVSRSELSIDERMEEILVILKDIQTVAFTQLFPYPNKQHIVITFLAVLQLLKDNQIHCEQGAQFDTILVSKMEE